MNNGTTVTFKKALCEFKESLEQRALDEETVPLHFRHQTLLKPLEPLPKAIQENVARVLHNRINSSLLIEAKRIFGCMDECPGPPDHFEDMLRYGVGVLHVQRLKLPDA